MSFIIYLTVGLVSGILGGMGMGGGTILIPALTIFLGANQHVAQATNVVSFLPMAAIVLPAHKRNGLLRTEDILSIIIPAVITTVLGGLVMSALPADILRKLFGAFLIALAIKQFFPLIEEVKKSRKTGV